MSTLKGNHGELPLRFHLTHKNFRFEIIKTNDFYLDIHLLLKMYPILQVEYIFLYGIIMKIGMMNHPNRDILDDLDWANEHNFDFLDLTLELPGADPHNFPIKKAQQLIKQYNLEIIGHTAYYLPFASPIVALRETSVKELHQCLNVFSDLNVKLMNIHYFWGTPLMTNKQVSDNIIECISAVLPRAKELDIIIMIENLTGQLELIHPIMEAIPELCLHLDVGHANLYVDNNTTEEFLKVYSDKLKHIHFSDNKGGRDDLHLPLGTGNIDWENIIRLLKQYSYDDTITLEIFSDDTDYLLYGKDKLRKLWDTIEMPINS